MGILTESCPGLIQWLEELSEFAGYLWQRGWAERNAGNVSVDVTDCVSSLDSSSHRDSCRQFECSYPSLAGRYFLVTGTGHRFRDIAKNVACHACILRISDDGGGYSLVWGGEGCPNFKPTSELPSHLRIQEYFFKSKSQNKVVLHTHPLELIALTHFPEHQNENAINAALWGIHTEVKILVPQGVGLVPYLLPGSEKLAEATLAALQRGHSAVVWEKHGCLAIGPNIVEAFDMIDTLNKAASLILLCKSAGLTPQGLTKEQLDEMARVFNLKE